MVFRGKLDIPVIDWRHYLEHRLDMHHTHQSFATRQRLLNYDGRASNQIIWFTDARPGTPQFDQTPQAFLVLDQWLENIKAHPSAASPRTSPPMPSTCFATNGSLLAKGDGVWNGILDDRPNGACTNVFPLYSSSRIVSGGPFEGSVFKCRGSRSSGHFDAGSTARGSRRTPRSRACRRSSPTGVCDYSKPDAACRPSSGAETTTTISVQAGRPQRLPRQRPPEPLKGTPRSS